MATLSIFLCRIFYSPVSCFQLLRIKLTKIAILFLLHEVCVADEYPLSYPLVYLTIYFVSMLS